MIESSCVENENRHDINEICVDNSLKMFSDDGENNNLKIKESVSDSLAAVDEKSDDVESSRCQDCFNSIYKINSTNIMSSHKSKSIIDSLSLSPKTSGNDSDKVVNFIETPSSGLLQEATCNHFQEMESIARNSEAIHSNESFHNETVPIYEKESVVTQENITIQKDIVKNLKAKVIRSKHVLMSLNIKALPDKGDKFLKHHEDLTKACVLEEEILSKMIASLSKHPATSSNNSSLQKQQFSNFTNLEAKSENVVPGTFEKQALATLNQQKNVTVNALQQIHDSISTRPEENQIATDPKGLKVELMPHQKHALLWLMWREEQKPSGGILADDMGLGKTLTMISLMLKVREKEKDSDDEDKKNGHKRKNGKYKGGTLVVCPASLLNQWTGEVQKRVENNFLSVEVYHGPKRESKSRRLSNYDMVVTTYSILQNENGKDTPLFNIKWRRVILDEAHQIRNHKCQTSVSAYNLLAKSRWVLTGTPLHNKELDLYSLLKFLRCSPFDDLTVWKKWVASGQDRFNTVISSLLLRRTKANLKEKGTLQCLPERNLELVEVTLNEQEKMIYQKVLTFSRNLFANYLSQRAQKKQEMCSKVHKTQVEIKVQKVKSKEILLLILRLRQICCHLSLITKALENRELLGDVDDEGQDKDAEEFSLLDRLNKLNLNDDEEPFAKISVEILNPSNPIFAKDALSSKVKAVLKTLKDKILSGEDKAVIVSQWTGFLKIIATNLKNDGIHYQQLDGSVPVQKRMKMVNNFNNPSHKSKVLLLSLTAGGVGLNLIGANHLLLTDLHWNPQLENQAQDRIYRVGQMKMVHVYKFIAMDTIEQQIKDLQKQKLKLAENMLTGPKIQGTKLTLDDLKLLFNMT